MLSSRVFTHLGWNAIHASRTTHHNSATVEVGSSISQSGRVTCCVGCGIVLGIHKVLSKNVRHPGKHTIGEKTYVALVVERYIQLHPFTPPIRMFLSLDLLSEYRIQHGAIGPLYVTSSYSIWIFCRRVSGFATDCPCDVWCRVLTTCLLHVGPPFGNRFLFGL